MWPIHTHVGPLNKPVFFIVDRLDFYSLLTRKKNNFAWSINFEQSMCLPFVINES